MADQKPSNKANQSNWASLRAKLSISSKPKAKSKTINQQSLSTSTTDPNPITTTPISKKWEKILKDKILALDCEMVGIGLSGKVSALARCSVVNFQGEAIYDEYVQPKDHVTDFRTKWSGIRKADISKHKAVKLEEVCALSNTY
jgi:interferon-stimulated 20 kDa exonuclease-like 2